MRRAVILGLVVVMAVVAVWKLAARRGSNDAPAARTSAAAPTAPGPRIARPPAVPAALSGRVTRRDGGAPIAGAVVAIASKPVGQGTGALPELPSTIVVTDASGAWSATAIAAGSYKVTASAVGFLPASTSALAIAAGERNDHVDLALASGGTTVSGTVSDIGGGPIAGARVTMRSESIRGARSATDEVIALSGDDGSYKLTLPEGGCAARVTHDDYTSGSKSFRVAAAPLVVDFVLVPGATIRGQVIASDGAPVPGAEVISRTDRRGFGGYGRATADADGRFTLRGIGAGALALVASGRGHASRNPTKLTVGVGEQVDNVKIVVDRGFSISGTIIDASTRKAIAGVRVHGFALPGGGASSEPTGADGGFELIGLGRGNYQLSAEGDGVMPEYGKSAEVSDKDVTGVVIEMATGVSLSGRVDPPVAAGVRIEIEKDKISRVNMTIAGKAFGVTADSDPVTGAFVLHQVPPGEFSVIATHADGRTGKLAVTVGDKDQTSLVVTLEPRASIAGKVIDASGAAVPGVRVGAEPAVPGLPGLAARRVGPQRDAVITGADGSFQIVGLDAGTLELSVRDDQGSLSPAHGDKLADVELARGQALTGLVLTVEPRDGKITGRVIGPDGKPAADAWVTAAYQPGGANPAEARLARMLGSGLPALTGAEGRFALEHLHRGSYQLVVDGPRWTSRAEVMAKVGDDVTITLAMLGTLSGHVTAGGAPVKTYDLDCRTADSPRFSLPGDAVDQHVSADDGSYSAEHIVPGSYVCTITSERGTARDPVIIPSGPIQHDFALVPFASVTGTIVDATGKPLAGLTVLNTAARGGPSSFAAMSSGNGPKTDASGRFDLTSQPLGDGRLMVFDGQMRMMIPAAGVPPQFTLTAGQRLDLGTIKVTEIPQSTGNTVTITSHAPAR